MPSLRVTCPTIGAGRRVEVAHALTDAVHPAPRRGDRCRRPSPHHGAFAGYGEDELFVGGKAAGWGQPDVTVEVSDWSMSTRQQARVAARLTPLLITLFGTDPDAVNLRFYSYPPTDFAVGGSSSARVSPGQHA